MQGQVWWPLRHGAPAGPTILAAARYTWGNRGACSSSGSCWFPSLGSSEHSARSCVTQGRTPALWHVLPHLDWRLWSNQRLVQVLMRFIFTGSILFGESPRQKHLLFLSTGTTDARPANRHKERAQTLPKFPPRIPTVNPLITHSASASFIESHLTEIMTSTCATKSVWLYPGQSPDWLRI